MVGRRIQLSIFASLWSTRASAFSVSKQSSVPAAKFREKQKIASWASIDQSQPLYNWRSRCHLNARPSDAAAEESEDGTSTALGVLVLLTVPLAWGTYAPVVKYVYAMEPPVPGFIFSAGYYIVAAFSLLFLSFVSDKDNSSNGLAIKEREDEIRDPLPIKGGFELGSYLFIGNGLQVVGLETVAADRAAFLVQLTTVMVPLVSAFIAGDVMAVPLRTWLACLLAFTGVVVMGFDGKEIDYVASVSHLAATPSIIDTFTVGDALIILAALSYTMHVIRLGKYAQFTSPLRLAASKATTEAALSVALVLGLFYVGESTMSGIPDFLTGMGSEISKYFSALKDASSSGSVPTASLLQAGGACLWTGWITCAYTIYAQSYGQRKINPTDANLIYTTQPLFSSLFAWTLLGETLGGAGFVGGALIVLSLWLVATSSFVERRDESMDVSDVHGDNFELEGSKVANESVQREREAVRYNDR